MLKLLDIVALVKDKPEEGLMRGQAGTIVELLAPSVYLVEFIDDEGQTYAMADLHADELVEVMPFAGT